MNAIVIACPACGAKNRVRNAPAGTLPSCGRCGAGLPWLTAGSDATFDADVTSPALVLVDMWAPWCGPCRMVAPVLEALARELAGRLKVVKLNVDDNPMTANRFGVRSIPTLLIVKDGRVVDQVVGAMPKGALKARLEPHLAPERAA
ncbi:MAG: thioredoxin [Deinococcales bacterium]